MLCWKLVSNWLSGGQGLSGEGEQPPVPAPPASWDLILPPSWAMSERFWWGLPTRRPPHSAPPARNRVGWAVCERIGGNALFSPLTRSRGKSSTGQTRVDAAPHTNVLVAVAELHS